MRFLRAPKLCGLRVAIRTPLWRSAPVNITTCAAVALALLVAVPDNRRMGTALHIALPVAAFVCGVMQGHAVNALARYVGLGVGIHLPKRSLGEHPLNLRPDGSERGFPSAHTAAATFGAVHLTHHCAGLHPVTKGMLLITAAFTGGSRIEAERHTLWQTMAGAGLGWVMALACWPALRSLRRIRNRESRS